MYVLILDNISHNIKNKLTIHTRFAFVKTENNNFIKGINHVLLAFIARWKPRQRQTSYENYRAIENPRRTDLLSNSPKRWPRFSPDYEGTEYMFLIEFLSATTFMYKPSYLQPSAQSRNLDGLWFLMSKAYIWCNISKTSASFYHQFQTPRK